MSNKLKNLLLAVAFIMAATLNINCLVWAILNIVLPT